MDSTQTTVPDTDTSPAEVRPPGGLPAGERPGGGGPGADSHRDPLTGWWRLALVVGAILGVGFLWNWTLVVIILAIILMIVLHELGHFLTARRAGMKVTQFFVGFGPRIWSTRRGEVEYGLKAIPAGAYVKIPGMLRDEEVDPTDEPRTYRQARLRDRVVMASAGSATHFALALLLFYGHFVLVGQVDPTTWHVSRVVAGSPADEGGIRTGDRLLSIGGVPLESGADLARVLKDQAGETVPVTVRRGTAEVPLTVTIGSRAGFVGTVGEDVNVFFTADGPRLSLTPGGLAEQAGFRSDDVVSSVNGIPIETPADLGRAARKSVAGSLSIAALRSDRPVTGEVDLGVEVGSTPAAGQLGVAHELDTVRSGPLEAVGQTVSTFGRGAWESVRGLGTALNPVNLLHFFGRAATTAPGDGDLTTATPAAETTARVIEQNSSRPISLPGAIGMAADVAKNDWGALLGFLALLNLFIGLFNLIPLVPFDGGHIAIAFYERLREKIRGGTERYFVDPARVYPIGAAVVMILGLLFISSLYLDVVDPIRL